MRTPRPPRLWRYRRVGRRYDLYAAVLSTILAVCAVLAVCIWAITMAGD